MKKYLFVIFTFLIFFLFPKSIEAIDISYCKYGDNLQLGLPVTIGVNIDGINLLFPFEHIHDYHYNDEIIIHDKESCEKGLELPVINPREYYVEYAFYYRYNESENNIYTENFNTPSFTKLDLTPPSIISLSPQIEVSVATLLELDYITSYIQVNDNIDTELIPEVIYDNYTSNHNKVGTYHIIFNVCDYSNNCSKYSQIMNVSDNIAPTINGPNKVNSYMSNPLTLIDIANQLKANDNHDGDITSKITIENNNYNLDNPGIYYAYFNVKDNSNNTITNNFKVEINYIDDISPTIEGASIFNSYLSAPLSTKIILSNLIISDNSDSKAYENVYILNDDYSNNLTKVGTYTLSIGTYDKYGNESLPYIITINVIDNINPTIDGVFFYKSYLSNPLTITNIKYNLIATDNHDGNLLNKIEVYEDTYTINSNKIGNYHISFIVKDSSNNLSNPFIVEISIFDDIAPIITGTNYYTTLITSKLNIHSLIYSLEAIDNIDGNISDKMEINSDNYSDNYFNEGTYFITVYVCDKSGNISLHFKIKIEVKNELTEIQKLNNSHIYLETNNFLSDDQILHLLGIDTNNYTNINTLENTYLNSNNHEGTYNISYEFERLNLSKEILNIKITTYINKEENNNTQFSYTKEKKETILDKIISFFTNIFNNLKSYFKSLFS